MSRIRALLIAIAVIAAVVLAAGTLGRLPSGWLSHQRPMTLAANNDTDAAEPDGRYLADVDGDGAADTIQVRGRTLAVFSTAYDGHQILRKTFDHTVRTIITGDFTTGGREHGADQICAVFTNGELSCYAASDDRRDLWWWFTQRSFVSAGEHTAVGDFDGDGADDLLVYTPASGAIQIFTRTADQGFVPLPGLQLGDLASTGRVNRIVYTGQFGGTGHRTDILLLDPDRGVLSRFDATADAGGRTSFRRVFTSAVGAVRPGEDLSVAHIEAGTLDGLVLYDMRKGTVRLQQAQLSGSMLASAAVDLGQLAGTVRGRVGDLRFAKMAVFAGEPGGGVRDDVLFTDYTSGMVSRLDARYDGSRLTYWWAYTKQEPALPHGSCPAGQTPTSAYRATPPFGAQQVCVSVYDRDHDGVADRLEDVLLARFRPYFKFSGSDGVVPITEQYRPTDAIWQLSGADMRVGGWPEAQQPPIAGACGDRNHDYEFGDRWNTVYSCLGSRTDLWGSGTSSDYHLNLNDDRRGGSSWTKARTSTPAPGLYGHVVPFTGYAGHQYLEIEYYQFFAYNGVGPHGWDHEGDWDSVELLYDPASDRVLAVTHWAHGETIFFDFGCHPYTKAMDGHIVRYIRDVPATFDHIYSGVANLLGDYEVRFYEPQPGQRHIVAYIERNSHEFWPDPSGWWSLVGEHNGNGPSYLPPVDPGDSFNLGEVEYPMSAQAAAILRFNGHWGAYHHLGLLGTSPVDNPRGPQLHSGWTWPENSPLHARLLAHHADFSDAQDPFANYAAYLKTTNVINRCA